MKVKSSEVIGDIVGELIGSIGDYEGQLRDNVGAEYPLTEVRVNLKEGRVFVVWEDYSEEEQVIEELTNQAIEIKDRIESTDYEVEKAVLVAKLGEIDEKYYELAGVHIYEVI